MEERAIYAVSRPQIKAEQLPREILVEFDDPLFRAPTATEVRLALHLCLSSNGVRLSGSEIGRVLGVTSRTVRRWMSLDPGDFKEMPYAAWRLVVIGLGLATAPDLKGPEIVRAATEYPDPADDSEAAHDQRYYANLDNPKA